MAWTENYRRFCGQDTLSHLGFEIFRRTERMQINNILSLFGTIAAAYALLLVVLFIFQAKLIYFPNTPSRTLERGPDSIGLAFESVDIVAEDGVRLHGWYIPADDRRGVVLFSHGNAGNMSHRLDSIKIFNDLGLDVLIFDYRGYGESDGSPSEQGTYKDGDAVWRYLTEYRAIADAEIIVFGRSLGAAIATYIASEHTPGGLIVESGFTSVPDLAAKIYPWLPVRWLTRIIYPNAERLQKVSSPVLVIHSRDDEIIPFDQGQMLFNLAHEPKSFLELRGGHNEGFLLSGQHYIDGLNAFLTVVLAD